MDIPRCPRCGEPPRYLRAPFIVRIGISFERDRPITRTGEIKLGKQLPGSTQAVYECGGKHIWSTEQEC